MEEIYNVTYHGEQVGTAIIRIQGLYYLVECSCDLPKNQRVNLFVNGNDLGILVPENGSFCLSKKIPRKSISGDLTQFYLVNRVDREDSILIPVCTERPFSNIEELHNGRFLHTEEGPMIQLHVN